jgi:flagellar biosynthetic protein FliO
MDDFLSLLFPMVVVVVIIIAAYLTTKWIAGKQSAFTSGNIIRVIERVAVGRDAYLLIVKVDDKTYLVSATNGGIELLDELPIDALEKYQVGNRKNDFTEIFMSLINKKGAEKKDIGRHK